MKALLLALALAAAGAPPTEAELAEAKAYFDAGKQAYEARQYYAAALAFEQAYELSKKAAVLFSTAQAFRLHYLLERDLTSLDRAIDLYRRYLVEVTGGSRRTDAAEHLASLELQLAQLSPEEAARRPGAAPRTQVMIASRTEGAMVRLDGADPAAVPLVKAVEPGKHVVQVAKPGFVTEELSVVSVEGRLVVAQVDLRAMPARLTVAAPAGARILIDGRGLGQAPLGTVDLEAGQRLVTVHARGKTGYATEVVLERGKESYVAAKLEDTGQRTVSYFVLGAAGLVAVSAITTGIIAGLNDASARLYLTRKDVVKEALAAEDLRIYRKAKRDKERFTRAFWGTFVASAVLTAVGSALYFLDEPGSGAGGGLTVAPTIGPGGTVGLGSTMEF